MIFPAVSCGPPANVSDGSVDCPDGHEYLYLCYVTCRPGYSQVSGAPFVRCREDKSWTNTQDCVGKSFFVFSSNSQILFDYLFNWCLGGELVVGTVLIGLIDIGKAMVVWCRPPGWEAGGGVYVYYSITCVQFFSNRLRSFGSHS